MKDEKENNPRKRPIVLLTGMSGAGLSTALKVFEDLGYEAVDNLRLGLVPALIEDEEGMEKALAVAIDSRNATFTVDELLSVSQKLKEREDLDVKLVFFECSDEALQRRFTETRRRHPLAVDRPLTDGIAREREILRRLVDEANHVIDTSMLSVHDLRRIIAGNYHLENEQGLTIFVTSFSFRHGLPREADLVFDARFLANPHWDVNLRSLTGQNPEVGEYIMKDPDYPAFMDKLTGLIIPLLPRYLHEGKSYLTIAIGCTGGRHRSVFIAEQLATILAGNGYIVGVGHRDLDRAANKA